MWGYLNQLDCSGTGTAEEQAFPLKIGPNPGSVGWQIASEVSIDHVEILDTRGMVLRTVAGNRAGTRWIDGVGLPVGMLIFRVTTAGKVYRIKVIKVN